jgi:two-component sensor histidine kinase
LKESENELASLRAQAENFESRLSEAVQKAQAETEKRLQSVYAYEKELRQKEVEGIINLKDHQIQTLQSKIKEMEQQLKEASAKVDVSEKTVKDIALKAIESANKTQFIEREKVKE